MSDVTAAPLLHPERLKALMADWSRECGARVQERRKALDWSQSQLSALSGVEVQTISKIENGQINPRDRVKVSIADALLCEVDELFRYPERRRVRQVAA